MTISAEKPALEAVYFDPYDVEINADPVPGVRPLREEAPLYYNEQYDFYALSRFADVNKALVDHETFSSARGAIVELIKANIDIPPGTVIFEDPPVHDIHRKLLARMFTPRKVNALEPKIREYCAQASTRWSARGRFDFVADLGAQMPMQVISALLGYSRRRPGDGPRTRQCDRCAPRLASPWRPTAGSSRASSSRPTSTGASSTRRTTS